jgi:hypothetical protein
MRNGRPDAGLPDVIPLIVLEWLILRVIGLITGYYRWRSAVAEWAAFRLLE